MNLPRISSRDPVGFHVTNYYCVCAYSGVRTNLYRSKKFRAGSYVDVTANFGDAATLTASQGDLMENQAIDANFYAGMYNNTIRVRY